MHRPCHAFVLAPHGQWPARVQFPGEFPPGGFLLLVLTRPLLGVPPRLVNPFPVLPHGTHLSAFSWSHPSGKSQLSLISDDTVGVEQ